jgi:peptidoglycan/LPS O-acetylase OafA/YrhL
VVFDHLTYSGLVLTLAGRGGTRIAGAVLAALTGQWCVSPQTENLLAIRKTFNSLELAGLTFAVAMLCRYKRVPHALAWLGLVSYSVYLLHAAC